MISQSLASLPQIAGCHGSKLYFLSSCTLPKLKSFVLLLFSLLNASQILWSGIPLLANVSSPPKRSSTCVDKMYNSGPTEIQEPYSISAHTTSDTIDKQDVKWGPFCILSDVSGRAKYCLEMVYNFYLNIFPVIYAGFYKQKEPHTFQQADSLKAPSPQSAEISTIWTKQPVLLRKIPL